MPPSTVYYPPSVVEGSVKKAQQEKSASIVSRALHMCKDKQVNSLCTSYPPYIKKVVIKNSTCQFTLKSDIIC